MKKIKQVLLALGCITLLFTGCDTVSETAISTSEEIAKPTSITLYDKGDTIDVSSSDEKFTELYDENKARASKISDSLNIAVDEEKFKLFKEEGISVNFKYDKEQILKYTDKDGKEKEVLYTELFFPLSDGSLAKEKEDSVTMIAIGKSSKQILVELDTPDKVLEILKEKEAQE